MKHYLVNPIGELLAAALIALVELAGRLYDRRVTRWAHDTHEGWTEEDE